jgi:putative isomerase
MALCDEWLSEFYGKLPQRDYALLDRSVRTLLGNILDSSPDKPLPWHPWRGITPSLISFRGIWNWDSAFHAACVSRWDPALAREQIHMFLDRQLPSGMLPDVVFENGRIVDDFGKPPVMPWAAMLVDMRSPDDEFLKRSYSCFLRYEAWWRKSRGGDAHGLFNYDSSHPEPETRLSHAKCESGWDNSVRWDGGLYELWPVDLNCFMAMLYRALAYMARRLLLPEDAKRWDLAGKAVSAKIEEKLWNPSAQAYMDFDFGKNAFNGVLSPASFMPLYVGTASPERAAAMARVAESESKFFPGWPTVAYDDPQFDAKSYWRGRTWLNVAYFALKGLKDYGFDEVAYAGRKTLLDWVRGETAQIFENYDPLTGQGLGVKQFSWSAVFTIEFLLNWDSQAG